MCHRGRAMRDCDSVRLAPSQAVLMTCRASPMPARPARALRAHTCRRLLRRACGRAGAKRPRLDTGVEHLGGHEMAEVVKSERRQPGGPAMPEKGFRHPVRLPRCRTVVVAEDECLSGRTGRSCRPVGEQLAGLLVEIDDVSAFRRRRREDGPVWSLDPTGTE